MGASRQRGSHRQTLIATCTRLRGIVRWTAGLDERLHPDKIRIETRLRVSAERGRDPMTDQPPGGL
jgi:hypothetical protein